MLCPLSMRQNIPDTYLVGYLAKCPISVRTSNSIYNSFCRCLDNGRISGHFDIRSITRICQFVQDVKPVIPQQLQHPQQHMHHQPSHHLPHHQAPASAPGEAWYDGNNFQCLQCGFMSRLVFRTALKKIGYDWAISH